MSNSQIFYKMIIKSLDNYKNGITDNSCITSLNVFEIKDDDYIKTYLTTNFKAYDFKISKSNEYKQPSKGFWFDINNNPYDLIIFKTELDHKEYVLYFVEDIICTY